MKLVLGDCIEVMQELPDESADALVTDPPGGISLLGLNWDSDHGGRDRWIERFTTAMELALRKTRPGGHGIVWSFPRTSHWTGFGLENAGWEIKNTVAHVFTSGFPKSPKQLKPAVELWWLVKKPGEGELNTAECMVGDGQRHPANFMLSHGFDCELVGSHTQKGRQMNRYLDGPLPFGGGVGKPHESFVMPNETVEVWSCEDGCTVGDLGIYFHVSKPSVAEQSAGLDIPNPHPACKSIGLMRLLVRLVTQHGETVLDPFAGSGSTAIACHLEGRQFVGIEQDPGYHRIASQRIDWWQQYPEGSDQEEVLAGRPRFLPGQMDLFAR